MIRPHSATCAYRMHRRFEILVDARILVLELDLAAAQLYAGKRAAFAVLRAHKSITPVIPAQREIARWRGAGIKMLVKPLIWRHDDTSPLPIDAPRLFTRRPQYGIALAAKNNHMRAWPMLMSFLVGADGEFRDMRAHGVLCQV